MSIFSVIFKAVRRQRDKLQARRREAAESAITTFLHQNRKTWQNDCIQNAYFRIRHLELLRHDATTTDKLFREKSFRYLHGAMDELSRLVSLAPGDTRLYETQAECLPEQPTGTQQFHTIDSHGSKKGVAEKLPDWKQYAIGVVVIPDEDGCTFTIKEKETGKMPVSARKIKGKYRLVEPSGRIAMTHLGHPKDGGGGKDRDTRIRQAARINMALRKAGRI